MENGLSVRSMLLDKNTGKLIKAVDERDFSDFVQLFARKNESDELRVFDFSKAIQYFDGALEKNIMRGEDREIAVKRKNVFNGWLMMRSLTNQSLKEQSGLKVRNDSDDALNWMHDRLQCLQQNYRRSKGYNNFTYVDETDVALRELSSEVEAYVEILMCGIHAMFIVDPNYFRTEPVFASHCEVAKKLLIDALAHDLSYSPGGFSNDSFLYQSCMEDKGVNPDVLLRYVGSDKSSLEIRRELINAQKIQDLSNSTRGYVVSWSSVSDSKVEHIKALCKLIQMLDSIQYFLEGLRAEDVSFGSQDDLQLEFENEIQSLMSRG